MKHLHVSYEALRCMPIYYRAWFSRRLIKTFEAAKPKDQYNLDDDTPISSLK